jgi:hypothetical protein
MTKVLSPTNSMFFGIRLLAVDEDPEQAYFDRSWVLPDVERVGR